MAKLETIWPSSSELIVGTIIIKALERRPGRLAELQLASIERAFRRQLKRCGCQQVPLWAYVDFSFNRSASDEYAPHWLPHIHLVTEAKYGEVLARLSKTLPRGTSLTRPAMFQRMNDWSPQVSYVCKPIPRDRRSIKDKPTQKNPLTVVRRIELALYLHNHHPRDRHFWCAKDRANL